MKTVLHFIRNIGYGGTEKFLLNFINNTSTHYNNIIVTYDSLIKSFQDLRNIRIICISDPNKTGLIHHYREVCKIIKQVRPDVVYSYTHYNSGIIMKAANKYNIPVRITHSHRSNSTRKNSFLNDVYTFFMKWLIERYSTLKIACGIDAAESLFSRTNNVIIINNGIDVDKYSFSSEVRRGLRKKHNIDDDSYVLGIVGRLDDNKNQEFAIKVLYFLKKNKSNVYLVIIGDGPSKQYLIEKVKKYKLDNNVIFLGNIENVNDYYNMMDGFIITSKKEGLPYVLIESQANGLPCYSSDSIDKSSDVSGNVTFASIEEPPEKWCEIIKMDIRNEKDYRVTIKDDYNLNSSIKKIVNLIDK